MILANKVMKDDNRVKELCRSVPVLHLDRVEMHQSRQRRVSWIECVFPSMLWCQPSRHPYTKLPIQLIIAPMIFLSFLLSLALVDAHDSALRSHLQPSRSTPTTIYGRMKELFHGLFYEPAPRAYVQNVGKDASGDEKVWYWRTKKQRQLIKAEFADAFLLRKKVLLLMVAVGITLCVCLTTIVIWGMNLWRHWGSRIWQRLIGILPASIYLPELLPVIAWLDWGVVIIKVCRDTSVRPCTELVWNALQSTCKNANKTDMNNQTWHLCWYVLPSNDELKEITNWEVWMWFVAY